MANGKNGNGNGATNCDTGELTAKQRLAAILLADPADKRKVESKAVSVGVSRATLHRWMRRPDFSKLVQEEFDKLRRAVAPRAYQELQHILDDPRAQTRDKIASAKALLEDLRSAGNVNVVTNVVQTMNDERKRELSEKKPEELLKILQDRMKSLGTIDDLVGVGGSSDNGKPEHK
jgi:hypothetical protein